MGWMDKTWALKLSPDRTIHLGSELIREFLRLDETRRFEYRSKNDPGGVDVMDTDLANAKLHAWTRAKDKCLSEVSMQDKLVIIAHGAKDQVGTFSAKELALWFEMWGLKNVGLITFKCCDVGRKNFLESLLAECVMKGINVGYLKAYRGTDTSIKGTDGKLHDVIRNKHMTLKQYLFESTEFNAIKEGDKRVKLIKGNGHCPEFRMKSTAVDI